ncbi:MAG: hypothetical protein C4K49_02995 [Candidatus Thorarchaeota archaeon]|nr:MAG: hypothetical protein C4K49_02995 [Candidatus Thorarchaeota archaeon]
MRREYSETVALDAGVLIALATGESSAKTVAERIADGESTFVCTELALCELSYTLCRRLGWEKAWRRIDSLVKSSSITVVPSQMLWSEAAKIKCDARIALPECFTLAAGNITNGRALFARRERELVDAIEKGHITQRLESLS